MAPFFFLTLCPFKGLWTVMTQINFHRRSNNHLEQSKKGRERGVLGVPHAVRSITNSYHNIWHGWPKYWVSIAYTCLHSSIGIHSPEHSATSLWPRFPSIESRCPETMQLQTIHIRTYTVTHYFWDLLHFNAIPTVDKEAHAHHMYVHCIRLQTWDCMRPQTWVQMYYYICYIII